MHEEVDARGEQMSHEEDAMPIEIVARSSREEIRTSRPRPLVWPAGLFLMLSVFVAADMAADIQAGTSAVHLVLELIALLVALAGVVGTGMQLAATTKRARVLQRNLEGTQADLEGTRADLERWRAEAEELQRGLGAAIDRQFDRWTLTSAEREVALLILKGLSYKEIAEIRGTTERTVRHQAFAIFKKAGLTGRAEMAAFFLEDLLMPRSAEGGGGGARPAGRATA